MLIEPVGDRERLVYASLLELLKDRQPARLTHNLKTGALRVGASRDLATGAASTNAVSTDTGSGEVDSQSAEACSSSGCPPRPKAQNPVHCHLEDVSPDLIEEMWGVPLRVLLFGATPLAHYLVPHLQSLDFDPLVVDWRSSYLKKLETDSLVRLMDKDAFAELLRDGAPADSCVVILSHVFDQDRDALCAALTCECAFVGMLSSRARREKIFEEARAHGITNESLCRVHSPLGLNIGSTSDSEIAVSILAELIQFRAGTVTGA